MHALTSGKQMLLSCDKCDKKVPTAPSKGESYLKQTQNTAATHTGRGADRVTCCSAAQKIHLAALQAAPFNFVPEILTAFKTLMQTAPNEVQHCASNCSPFKGMGQPAKAP